MVHNGIEYGLMQAYAEGFDILKNKASDAAARGRALRPQSADIAEVWRRGSVVSSWLLDLIAEPLADDAKLSKFTGDVADSGEGRWTIEAAIEEAVPAEVLSAALYARFRSRQDAHLRRKIAVGHAVRLRRPRRAAGGRMGAPPVTFVVSDVDGTLVTPDKTLTPAARAAVERLRAAGVAFTIVSSRPVRGMESWSSALLDDRPSPPSTAAPSSPRTSA